VARTNAEVAWRRDEKLQEALTLLRARAAAAPKDRKTRLLLAKYLAIAGERREQIAVLDGLIAEKSDVDLLLDRAGAKLAADDPKGALADFRKAAADGPDETRVQNSRASFERLESALVAVAVLDKSPAGPEAHFNKSYFWFYGGVPGRGLTEAVEGLRGWPDSAYGKILETRGQVASGALTSAKALAERHVDVSAPLDEEKARRGILQADAVLAKKPGDPQSLINRTSWLASSAQFALAADDIQAVLKANPSNITALQSAAAISLRQGNLPAATATAEKLKSLKASREVLSDVYAGLAQIAFEQSKFPLALDFAARSIEAKPLAKVWKLKAACHTRLGQPNEAAEALKQSEKGSR
jgi:tetratricopeptide (TPR) repeat protein